MNDEASRGKAGFQPQAETWPREAVSNQRSGFEAGVVSGHYFGPLSRSCLDVAHRLPLIPGVTGAAAGLFYPRISAPYNTFLRRHPVAQNSRNQRPRRPVGLLCSAPSPNHSTKKGPTQEGIRIKIDGVSWHETDNK